VLLCTKYYYDDQIMGYLMGGTHMRVGELKMCTTVLSENLKERVDLRQPRVDGLVILKCI
jgi:hypothetical protein